MMKYFWIFTSLIACYIGLVAVVEMLVWRLQPNMENSLSITTTGADGSSTTRKLARFEHKGQLYVSSNHWFRSWYHQALANPVVEIEQAGVATDMRVIQVTGDEHDEALRNYDMGFVLRLFCGFAPSRFLRLEPFD